MPEIRDWSRGVRGKYAERIAREGYEIVLPPPGRPKKGAKAAGPSVVKSVRLPPVVWARLEARARREGVPLHALVRRVLCAFLAEAG